MLFSIYYLFLILQLLFEPLGEIVEREAVVEVDVAHTGAAEGRQMGSAAKGLADVAGQGTDIGALATDDADGELHRLRVETDELDVVDMDVLGSQFDITTLTGELIGSVASHHTGGVDGRHLLDIAHELRERLLDELTGDVSGRISGIDLMLEVEAGCGGSELQGGGVLLGMELQTLDLLGGLTRTKDEDTRGQRVERAGMTDLHPFDAQSLGEDITDMGQSSEAGHPIGLVDIDISSFLEVHHTN